MEKKTVVDALTIIRSEYERNPARSMLAIGSSESCRKLGDAESCIGAWDEKQARFVMVASKLIGDHGWVSMPYELLINGERPAIDWTPIEKESILGL